MDEGVFALPVLDPYVQGYRDRDRFVDPSRFGLVYDAGGNATATLVHRGRIIGVWQFVREPFDGVRYHLFGHTPAGIRNRAETALASAGALFFEHSVDVTRVATMKPLRADGGRSALHPLDATIHRASRHHVS